MIYAQTKGKLTSPYDFVLIKAEKTTEETVKFGDGELFIDTSYDPLIHSRIYGKVITIPDNLTDQFIGLKPEPKPIATVGERPFRKLSDIEQNVKVGDTIYFHYSVLSDGAEGNIVALHDGDPVFKVRYDRIWARKDKKGNIEGVGSNVLVAPIKETWEDVTIPIMTGLKDEHGQPIPKPKDQWLMTKICPEEDKLHGIIRYSSPPFKGEVKIEQGVKCLFRANADFKIAIDGKFYYTMKSHNIFAYLD